jgi:hypothetical protein
MVITLNRKTHERQELRIVYEWNPYYRGRRLWWLWRFTPYVVINAWV